MDGNIFKIMLELNGLFIYNMYKDINKQQKGSFD